MKKALFFYIVKTVCFEVTEMQTEFDINLTEKDMYRFSMYHNYTSFQGVFSVLIAIASFAAAAITRERVTAEYTILYIVFGILFLVYVPCSLKLRAKRQFQSSGELQNTLRYRIDEDGITVSQNGESAELLWKQVYKITATRHNVLIYSSRVNAFVIPRSQLGEKYQLLKELAGRHLEKFRYCIRR